MNTLTMTVIQSRTPPSTAQNPDPAVATLLAVALEVPEGGLDHRVDLAAVALRLTGETFAVVGDFHCVLHAGMPAALIAEHCRLPLDQVTDRTPVAVAVSMMDRHLAAPPYRILTHQAAALRTVIDRHSDQCPAMTAAELVDTARLARRLLAERCPPDLAALAAHLGITITPRVQRTVRDAALTGAVYAHLHRIGSGAEQSPAGGATPHPRPARDGRADKQQVRVMVAARRLVRRGRAV
ncbi:MAG TPA: hypothetical protein VFA06_06000 [Actinocrinis sp.]|nr:hypothetical protein [Actinocrinis sp.]